MQASHFDKRRYPTVDAATGYGEWAPTYEETVAVGLDRPLLARLTAIDWPQANPAADLACGTGRTGEFLAAHGVAPIDGVDITPQMLERAAAKRVYRRLKIADLAATPLASGAYRLCTMALADEHLASLAPVYREAARLLAPGGQFLLIGYHPFFLLNGQLTHFHRADGSALTIESHLHLFSEHHQAGRAAGLALETVEECVIDEAWLATKPKWRPYLNWPVSFALVWRRS
jgi:SAM-dependent methyltransferase